MQKNLNRLVLKFPKLRQTLLFLCGFALYISCEKNDKTEENISFLGDSTIQYKEITGVDSNLLSLDVYTIPESKSLKPVVIWIHGGGWAIGDKLNTMEIKVPFFRAQQYVFVSLNYRLSPVPYELNNSGRVKYPDHIMDVADAITWIFRKIELYGGNPEKMVLMGHSAGAHLAALVTTDQKWLVSNEIEPSWIKGVMPLDTEAFNLEERINRDSSELFLNAFTFDEVAWREASPVFQIEQGELLPENWLVVERGTLDRRAILNEFVAKLESVNAKVTRVVANNYSHEEVNQKIGEEGEILLNQAIEKFLKECFFQ